MKTAFECKTGSILSINGDILMVIKYDFRRGGRGSTTVNLRLKNLINGSLVNKVFDGNDKLDDVYLTRQKFEYMYESGGTYYFMNQNDFEQIEINGEDLGDSVNYLKEGMLVDIQEYEGKFIGVILPATVTFKIIETTAGMKSNTVDGKSPLKEAKVESGMVVMVPLYMEEGEDIVIRTDTGEFMERAK